MGVSKIPVEGLHTIELPKTDPKSIISTVYTRHGVRCGKIKILHIIFTLNSATTANANEWTEIFTIPEDFHSITLQTPEAFGQGMNVTNGVSVRVSGGSVQAIFRSKPTGNHVLTFLIVYV